MNPYRHFIGEIEAALRAMQAAGELPEKLDFSAITAEPPRDAAHGDIATNAAMVLAKAAHKKPRDIAEPLLARLKANPDVVDGAVAGPGSATDGAGLQAQVDVEAPHETQLLGHVVCLAHARAALPSRDATAQRGRSGARSAGSPPRCRRSAASGPRPPRPAGAGSRATGTGRCSRRSTAGGSTRAPTGP